MVDVNSDEYDELSELAQIHDAVQDIREVQREHTARLDEHFEFHQAHAAGFAMLTDAAREHGETLREHGGILREILRRLDAA